MKIIYFLILMGCQLMYAQNDMFIGVTYGSSDLFRQDDASHYNYKNSEIGVFLEKNFAWKSNSENSIKKYWILQPKLILGDYVFYADDIHQKIFRGDLSAGIKFVKEFNKISAQAKFNMSSGYQTGYHQRLEKGVFFTEKLNLGLEFQFISKLPTFVDVGVMHISNANFYPLNRGLEVFFIEVGFKIL